MTTTSPPETDLQSGPPGARRAVRLSPSLREILRCPRCLEPLQFHRASVSCGRHEFPVVRDVPIFTDEGKKVDVRPADHVSHQASESVVDYIVAAGAASGHRPWLHLGAGATLDSLPNSIELETAVFRNTHVVGDVHRLPFADGSLGGVLALNVFEHLSDPDRAAAELRRCLAPGAPVVIQTAFLQPLHSDPFHFFNATETGVRRWFEHFTIDSVTVPFNFNPVFALSWMSNELMHYSGNDPVLAGATIADLAAIWKDDGARQGALWDRFVALPDHVQRVLAAGFELRARRPPDAEGTPQ